MHGTGSSELMADIRCENTGGDESFGEITATGKRKKEQEHTYTFADWGQVLNGLLFLTFFPS